MSLIFLMPISVLGAEESKETEKSIEAKEKEAVAEIKNETVEIKKPEPGNNDFHLGVQSLLRDEEAFSESSLSMEYERAIAKHFSLAINYFSSTYGKNDTGGVLAQANFYRADTEVSADFASLRLSYFINEYAASGLYASIGGGSVSGEMKYSYNRYDQDPGVFVFGNGERLKESGSGSVKYSKTFVSWVLGYKILSSRVGKPSGVTFRAGLMGHEVIKPRNYDVITSTDRKTTINSKILSGTHGFLSLGLNY